MTAFIIVSMKPNDPEKLQQYSAAAAQTFDAFDGEIITKGAVTALHGDVSLPAKAVIQFPSAQHASDWYQSDAYQALISLRNEAMTSEFHLVG
ncbi:DUF1330 domain-containing protein [Kordiimonas aquimaris]|uniref:DUF1330 domain-containing protein n=1 Tax=Kordiimonas aquimaris TaxID=707591 RepID=UPI0021D0EB11|nr:DUF1330 domain-containing protein [Kordiimonas aquimaris]